MPPFAGQGMCSGIRDAVNLAWKLDAVARRRWRRDRLLDTYTEERLPHVRGVIELSMELGKIICVPDPAEAAARDEMMSAGVTDDVTAIPPPASADRCAVPVGRSGRRSRLPAGHRDVRRRSVRASTTSMAPDGGWSRSTTAADRPSIPQLADWFAAFGGEIVAVALPTTRRHVRRLVRRARCDLGVAATRLPRPRRRPDADGSRGAARRPAPPPALTATPDPTPPKDTTMKIANVNGRATLVHRRRDRRHRVGIRRSVRLRSDEPVRRLDRIPRVRQRRHGGNRPAGRRRPRLSRARARAQVFAIGLNYRSHAEESGMELPTVPATFTKFPSSLTGPFDDVEIPNGTVRLGGRARRRHRPSRRSGRRGRRVGPRRRPHGRPGHQ